MNIKVFDEVDDLYEILKLLSIIENDTNIENLIQTFSNAIKSNPCSEKKETFNALISYITTFKNSLNADLNELHFFFKNISASINDLTIASLLINTLSLKTILNKSENLNFEEIKTNFKKLLLEQLEQTCDIDSLINTFDSLPQLVKYLDSTINDNDSKWKVIMCLNDIENVSLRCFKIIQDSYPIYLSLKNNLKPIKNSYVKYLNDCIKENPNHINAMTNVHFPCENIEVYLSLASPLSVNMAMGNDLIVVHYGALFDFGATPKKIQKDIDNIIISTSKCLSDNSKLNILKLLKDTSLYGQQLAEKLEITTATISYHMSTLMSNNLITMNKKDGRIYYKLNTQSLSQFINILENEFLSIEKK